MKWRPIEKCPRKGDFLALDPRRRVQQVSYMDDPWKKDRTLVCNSFDGRWFTAHWWMPLPKLPEVK